MDRMLETDEAARRLGVKVTTLYAYVSRGLLRSHRAPEGRRSLFEVDEVERLARRSREGRTVETRMAVITTGITQLTESGPLYRGRHAVDLATTTSFEDVAELLWNVRMPEPERTPWSGLSLGEPPVMRAPNLIEWSVVVAGALDPVRADLRPDAVVRTARQLIATVAGSLVASTTSSSPRGRSATDERSAVPLILDDGGEQRGSIATLLTAYLSPAPTPALVRAVNAAMVLLADHELASSTMAVRVAASTRADPYEAVLAGLGTVAGPLHGAASQQVCNLLYEAERVGVERAVDDTLRWQGLLPGFGHTVYTDGDPRYEVLRRHFDELATPQAAATVEALVGLAAAQRIPPPNVDLGLAAITWATDLPAEAGQILFTLARISGWIAHYLEELGERPLRYRARAVYAAPADE
jgi:citrate synthase